MPLLIERVGYALGARITGIDLRSTLDEDTVAQIRSAWLDHLVVYFPGQELTHEQHRTFSANLGTLDDLRHTPFNRYEGYVDLMVLAVRPPRRPNEKVFRAGDRWHSDLSTTLHPTSASLLLCKERPAVGGDTVFANQYQAYATLSKGMQEMLEQMEAIHDISAGSDRSNRTPEVIEQQRRLKPPVLQPAVRTHPETGRKALYLDERIVRFKDMTVAESRPIVEHLVRHAVQDEFVYRHRWSIGDLVIWDNRCLLHKALADYDMLSQSRVMYRTSILGHRSGHYFSGDSVEAGPTPVTTSRH